MGKILVYDYGTTALKLALFDSNLNLHGIESKEFAYEYPKPNYVELDANEFWESAVDLTRSMAEKCSLKDVEYITFTSNAETIIPVDSNGNVLLKAIIWMDSRAENENNELKQKIEMRRFYDITGLNDMEPIWPINKIKWIKNNHPDIYNKTYKFLLLKDYIIFKLTGKAITDPSIASYFGAIDIDKLYWSNEIIQLAGVDKEKLPDILPPSITAGTLMEGPADELGLKKGISVLTGMLDQCASAIGALNITEGMVTETTGTVLAITSTIDHATPYQKEKMMPYIAHGIPGKYLAITFMTTAGIVLKWFKDNFCYDLIDKAKAENRSVYELLDELVDGTRIKDDLIMIPHFCGCTYPVSNPYAKGMLGGITLDITRADVVRAIYESIAFMLHENLEYFEHMGIKTTEIVSLGGGARSNAWLKIKSDVLKKSIVTLNNEESTTLGAAAAAAVFAGYLSDFSELSEVISIKNKIKPDMSGGSYEKKYSKYLEFYSCVKDLYR